MQRLAAGLAQRLPWLARGHIGSLCHTLNALGLDENGWTANDIITMLDNRNTHHGLYSLASSSQRNPLALFAHQVRSALVDIDEPPRHRRNREAAERTATRAQARAERTATRAQARAERNDPAIQARITEAKRQIREHITAARQARYRR